MVALQATEAEVLPLLPGTVSIAAVNGPQAVVISGDETAVTEISAHFTAQGRKTRRLRVSHAFHSPLMQPMLEDFRQAAESVTYHPPSIPVVSNLTGEPVTDFSADYWIRHVRQAVRFADGLTYLHSHGVRTFIELGPDGVLSAMGRDRGRQPVRPGTARRTPRGGKPGHRTGQSIRHRYESRLEGLPGRQRRKARRPADLPLRACSILVAAVGVG